MEKNQKSYNDIYKSFGSRTLNLGLAVGVSIVICTIAGYCIDQHYSCAPKGIICGSIFGIIAGLVNMWEQIQKMNKSLGEENERKRSTKNTI